MTAAASRLRSEAHQSVLGSMSPVALATACLRSLILLNLVQVAAGLAGIDPSPPSDVIPLIAAIAALGVAASVLVRAEQRLGYQLAIAFSLVSMIGMGPHKLFLEDGAILAPVAVFGFVAEVVLIVVAVRALRAAR